MSQVCSKADETMKLTNSKIFLLGVLVGSFLLFPVSANAIGIFGNGPLGSFTGDFSYNDVLDTVTVQLTNTSPVANGGFLTAFLFNNPGFTSISNFSSTSSAFNLIGGVTFNNSVSATPAGFYDVGASSTNGQFLGGGNPTSGIPVGATETFVFALTGVSLLDLDDFLNTPSSNGGSFFIARFRGFNDGGSNKVPGNTIPEPATMLLVGTGLAGLAGFRRKFRK